MGYMGFGMQKWISARPRKFMSKEIRHESTDSVYQVRHSKNVFDGNPGESDLRSGDPVFANRELQYKKVRKIIYLAIAFIIVLLYFILA